MERMHGFSLVEMLLTLALFTIVAGFSVLDLGRMIRVQRYHAVMKEVATHLALARAEARVRRLPVHACAANFKNNLDVQGCQSLAKMQAPYHWGEGVMVFYDKQGGRSDVYDSKELLTTAAIEPALNLQLTASQPMLTFNPDGMMRHALVVLEFSARQDAWCQRLTIYKTGLSSQRGCD
ncbi:GspH/FimT family pseudopilin [Vogesella oryzae]|uniref:GspH/FimT family pseudopilin n=1 Tax=Vogesella oryzae TaxID=1735285 RepID=UPI001583B3FB|nr:GspH/FimT family pseudopilin [Vogesella oryzae]